jgi:hypothetical protein
MPTAKRSCTALTFVAQKRVTGQPKNGNAIGCGLFLLARFRKALSRRWVWPFPKPPMSPGEIRAAMLNAVAYLDGALDAQIEADAAAVRDALEVARAMVDVALSQLHAPSSENRVLQ